MFLKGTAQQSWGRGVGGGKDWILSGKFLQWLPLSTQHIGGWG